jgi:alkylhydroperoxidase family enzyme
MSRVRLVPRSEITDEYVLEKWAFMYGDKEPVSDASGVGPGGTRGDYWPAIVNSPATVKYVYAGFDYNGSQDLAPALRELGMTRAGWDIGSKFVFSQHCKGLRRAGWSEEKIESVGNWQTADCYSELERLLFAYADDLVMHHGRVPDQRFDALHKHLSDREIVEFTHSTLMYAMNATVCRALQVEYDDVAEHVSEVPSSVGLPGTEGSPG